MERNQMHISQFFLDSYFDAPVTCYDPNEHDSSSHGDKTGV
jgi:hypothetical protein